MSKIGFKQPLSRYKKRRNRQVPQSEYVSTITRGDKTKTLVWLAQRGIVL